MSNCIFCRIVNKQIPASVVYEDDFVFAFRDINPQAPVHILVIPKKHIISLNDISSSDSEIIYKIFAVIQKIVKIEGVRDSGFRVVANCGAAAGQAVDHLHFHILGNRKLNWPPG